MKNKIAKKLIFSAVALGASVLTLTTTTYAWYVQNNTVTATNITGSTKSNDAGSLFITKDGTGETPQWGPKVEFLSADLTNATLGNAKGELTPLTLLNTENKVDSFSDVSGTKTVAEDDGNGGTNTVSISKGKVVTVNFWLMSNKANVQVQPTLQVKNTTGDGDGYANKVSQTAYSSIKAKKMSTGENPQEIVSDTNLVDQGQAFWIDAVQALRMSVITQVDDEAASAPAVYDVKAIAKSMTDKTQSYALKTGSLDEENLGIDDIVVGTNHHELKGAHAYYYRFVGQNPAATFTSAINPSKTWDKFQLSSTKKTKFTFTFWLEGTDVSCFDCCSSQSFEFAFDFSVVTQ